MSSKGRFVWYELLSKDAAAAKAFYEDVVGWEAEAWEEGSHPYSIWSAGDGQIGGLMQLLPEHLDAGTRPHWWAHVTVDDVDQAAARAEDLGGKIHTPPTDIPQIGRFAAVTDPLGALLSLFKPNQEAPPPEMMKVGHIAWNELNTSDYEATWNFYAELFGWKTAGAMDMGEAGQYMTFRHPDDPEAQSMGGMFDAAKISEMPVTWLYYINVEAIEPALERTKKNGGRVLNGPNEVPGGRAAQCLDDQGVLFALFSEK
ncbi:MAG TPA: VOC family protein [Thermoanaerobaculia bacterium]|nr:VOC family protein [Thermoanaerobaculia bacterium]